MSLVNIHIKPSKFPEFKKIKKDSHYSQENTNLYKKIGLRISRIFAHLEQQDLYRTELICREQKHLIENSTLAGEDYTLALKRAVQEKNRVQQSVCIEKLGDVYLSKGKREALLQAAGLYNYVLRLTSTNRKEIIEEKLFDIQRILIELCEGKPLSLEHMRKQFEDNRAVLKKIREDIEKKIHALPETPSSAQVRKLYRRIAQKIKFFFESLAMQAFGILGPKPCEYAMIGFGSLAREEMTPYSDLEFGILISADNTENRKYFKRLTTLIHLKVINLGETILPALNIPCIKETGFFDSITPRGFAFDGAGVEGKGCKTPVGNGNFRLIQTPEKMAQYIGKDEKGKWWHEREPHLPMELLTFTHLLGNHVLTKQYKQKIQQILNAPYQENFNLRQYLAKKHLVEEDMKNFDPSIDDLERQGMLFKVKNDFYRFPHLALDRLALLKKVKASDTFTRIDELNKQEVLTQIASKNLKEWMSIALFMRLKTYSHYQAQQETMNPLIKPFGFEDHIIIKKHFASNCKTVKKIKKIYQIFIPFYQAIQEFFAGNEDTLKFSILEDASLQTQGDIAARLFQYKEAKDYYSQALKENPENVGVLNALGMICYDQGELDEAIKYVERARAIDERCSDTPYLNIVRDYNNLGTIAHSQRNLEDAIKYFNQAIEKITDKKHPTLAMLYNNLGQIYQVQWHLGKAAECVKHAIHIDGKNFLTLATYYNNLGKIYLDKNKLNKATKYVNHALTLNQGLFSENHFRIGINYNNLALIYQAQGKLKEATGYFKRSLAITGKLFGENHPALATRYNNLATIYKDRGGEKLKKALMFANKACDINIRLFGKNHPTLATRYNNLAKIYKDRGGEKLKKALTFANKACDINIKLFGKNHPIVANDRSTLGTIYHAQRRLKEAAHCFNQAFDIDIKHFKKNHPNLAIRYINRGVVYMDLKKFMQAAIAAKKALDINRKMFPDENHPNVAVCYNSLGMIHKAQGFLGCAAEHVKKALIINLKLFVKNHPSITMCYNNLGTIYQKQGNIELANKCFKLARRNEPKLV
ncbi:tetratricopeptide repeat protein [Neochlamydia sp. AcF95]|uniref:tetratricopeptide repeat protein n=1 Tax=Neochlamydia sp. AcF95 TaxID=2795734 RepID=UPI001BC9284F|nr:tetratricopeptide repeat protein [Neochlamydia sp. AcF95]MBS4169747.1 Uncharacterized protein [Neochlamydia sp. AcF95]